MSYISVSNSLSHTIARQACSDEPWFKRLPMAVRGRCVSDIAAEIADAVNGSINHYRENLGAFDVDPQPAEPQAPGGSGETSD